MFIYQYRVFSNNLGMFINLGFLYALCESFFSSSSRLSVIPLLLSNAEPFLGHVVHQIQSYSRKLIERPHFAYIDDRLMHLLYAQGIRRSSPVHGILDLSNPSCARSILTISPG